MFQNQGSLQIIMGPMFSGKTTELINIYNKYCKKYGKDKCLTLNYALDNRYDNDKIVSHDSLSIPCNSILKLEDYFENNINLVNISNASFIFINEAQFFDDLTYYVLNLKDIHKKHIILCGLDLDFQRKKFGQLFDLNIYANKVIYLHGKCSTFGCNYLSLYSHRVAENNNQLLVGGANEYIPLCKFCYETINKISNKDIIDI